MTSKYPRAFGKGACRQWSVTADLGKFPLNPGLYTVKLYLGKGYQDIVVFDDAITIEVIQNDILGNGNGIPDTWGIFHWNPIWSIAPTPC